MKRILLTLVVLSIASRVIAQQDPYYTNWMFNRLAFNPAYAGSLKGAEFTALQRIKFVDSDNFISYSDPSTSQDPGAFRPQTSSLNVSLPYKKHGFGLNFYQDQIGHEKTGNVNLAYNYKVSAGNGTVSFGMSAGIIRKVLDSKFNVVEPNDVNIPREPTTSTAPDLGLGVYYSNPAFYHFYVGISAQHLIQQKIHFPTGIGYTLSRHYYAMTGVELPLSYYFKLRPNISYKNDGATSQMDFNLDLLYNEKWRAGVSYRNQISASILVGFNPNQYMNIGYSYDYPFTAYTGDFTGSHEVFITYLLVSKKERAARKPGVSGIRR